MKRSRMHDVEQLERRALEGDPAAMTAVGKLALISIAGPRSPQDGVRLLAQAAEAGDAEADAMIAVLIGAEARSLADWHTGLDYLGRAARRGWEPARRQLAVLCRNGNPGTGVSTPRDLWRNDESVVDVESLIGARSGERVFDAPRVTKFREFASPAECAWLIGCARPRIARAATFHPEAGGGRQDEARTNSAVLFNILETDFILLVLRARIAASCGMPARALEETNVLHYAPGQQFRPHYDFLDVRHPAFEREVRERGQRILTFLIYLNEDFRGGETSLLKLRWRFRGRPGDALLFTNTEPSGAPDPRTLHAGLMPTQGEKWLLSQWIRDHRGPHGDQAP